MKKSKNKSRPLVRRACLLLACTSLALLLLCVLKVSLFRQDARQKASSFGDVQPEAEKDGRGLWMDISATPAPQNAAPTEETLSAAEPEQDKPAVQAAPGNAGTKETSSGEWTLVFEDGFSSLDTSKWTPMRRRENYNRELQFYVEQNAQVKEGKLYLIAKKERLEGRQYTSALVDTGRNFSFQYGRIDVRLRLPEGRGLLPAVWLLPVNPSSQYELDLLEALGHEPSRIYGVCHFEGQKTYGETVIESPGDFHTYSLEWSEEEVKWFVDDTLYFRTTQGVPHEPMYIIMNLAVGGEWPGSPDAFTPFPNALVVDDIRVYQKASAHE